MVGHQQGSPNVAGTRPLTESSKLAWHQSLMLPALEKIMLNTRSSAQTISAAVQTVEENRKTVGWQFPNKARMLCTHV